MTDGAKLVFALVDEPTAAAIGRVSIEHGRLQDALAMLIKSIAKVSPGEARRANDGARFVDIASRGRKLAFKRLGDGQALVKLDAVLNECRNLNKRRNDLLHSLWAHREGGEPLMRVEGAWETPPDRETLLALADRMHRLRDEIHDARLVGWLSAALDAADARDIQEKPSD